MQRQFFLKPAPWGSGEESKGQKSFNFNYKVYFKDFIPNFVCVLTITNEICKTYQTGFLFCRLGHATGVGLWGAGGAQGVQKSILFKHGHVAYQIDGDDEQNRMRVTTLTCTCISGSHLL